MMGAVNMDERQNSNDPLLLASAPAMCVLTGPGKQTDDMAAHTVVPRGLLVQTSHRPQYRTLTPMVMIVLGTLLMACSFCVVSWQTIRMQDLQSQVDNLTAITSKLRQEVQKISTRIETVDLMTAFENSKAPTSPNSDPPQTGAWPAHNPGDQVYYDDDEYEYDDEDVDESVEESPEDAEGQMKDANLNDPSEEDDMEDEEEDNLAPSYPDAEEDQHFVVEAKETQQMESLLERLLPAGSRGKRSIAQAPRLRLYDTLAVPSDAATTARPWLTPERRQPHHKAPMFAERPPLGYVTQPVTPETSPPTTPMTSRRSRVMAGSRQRQRAQQPSERLELPQGQDVQRVEQDEDAPQDYADNLDSREVRLNPRLIARTPRVPRVTLIH